MNKPTQAEIETTIKVLDWLEDDTRENEPWATSLLSGIEEVKNSLPEGD